MSNFLTRQRTQIEKRLKELKPLVDEYLTLERAKEALESLAGPRRGPGRPRGSTRTATAPAARRGRRRSSWADRALRVVRANPGVTTSQIGDKLGMKQKNYLYRVMAGLQGQGAVKKQGKGWVAT